MTHISPRDGLFKSKCRSHHPICLILIKELISFSIHEVKGSRTALRYSFFEEMILDFLDRLSFADWFSIAIMDIIELARSYWLYYTWITLHRLLKHILHNMSHFAELREVYWTDTASHNIRSGHKYSCTLLQFFLPHTLISRWGRSRALFSCISIRTIFHVKSNKVFSLYGLQPHTFQDDLMLPRYFNTTTPLPRYKNSLMPSLMPHHYF